MTGIGHGLFAFLRAYILRAGFLDGAEGFLLAVVNAETQLLSLHEGVAFDAQAQVRSSAAGNAP